MNDSPITNWLADVSRFDIDAALASFAPHATLLSPDGRRADGTDTIRALLGELTSELRALSYEVTAQWHEGDTWIAEVQTTYELSDYAQIGPLPRAVIARVNADGITDLRIYGAHERTLAGHRAGEDGMWVGKRWIPPL